MNLFWIRKRSLLLFFKHFLRLLQDIYISFYSMENCMYMYHGNYKKKFFYFFKLTIFLPINALNDIHLMFKIVMNKKKITVLNCFKSSYDTHLRLYNHVHVKWRREMGYNYTYSPSEPHLSADDSCCVIVPEVVAHRAPRDIVLWDLYTSFGFR